MGKALRSTVYGTGSEDGVFDPWLGLIVEQAVDGAPDGNPLTSMHPRMLLTISTLTIC